MKTLLLPHKYKKIGWMILIPATVVGLVLIFTDFDALELHTTIFAVVNDNLSGDTLFGFYQTNITPSLIGILFIIGALLVGFSKERSEDEFIAKLRLNSML